MKYLLIILIKEWAYFPSFLDSINVYRQEKRLGKKPLLCSVVHNIRLPLYSMKKSKAAIADCFAFLVN